VRANTDDGKKTARLILDTAAEVFAEVGFAGARVDEIARRAGVNKAMIYYHIGDKNALYEAVLSDVFRTKAAEIEATIEKTTSPEDQLKTYVRSVLESINERPLIPSIMLREVASGAKDLPHGVRLDFLHVFRILHGIIQRGVAEGCFVDTAPFIVHFMIAGSAIFHSKLASLMADESLATEANDMSAYLKMDIFAEIEKLILNAIRRT
jgi:TetR/AcrR family transcriptional regulator